MSQRTGAHQAMRAPMASAAELTNSISDSKSFKL